MISRRMAVIGALALVAGCSTIGESRFNPFNWISRSEPEDVPTVAEIVARVDARPAVARILDISLEPTPTGAILTAVGLPRAQGHHAAALVLVSRDGGRVIYAMRAMPPARPIRVGSDASRRITAAAYLSRSDLAAARVIEVLGAENGLAIRR